MRSRKKILKDLEKCSEKEVLVFKDIQLLVESVTWILRSLGNPLPPEKDDEIQNMIIDLVNSSLLVGIRISELFLKPELFEQLHAELGTHTEYFTDSGHPEMGIRFNSGAAMICVRKD